MIETLNTSSKISCDQDGCHAAVLGEDDADAVETARAEGWHVDSAPHKCVDCNAGFAMDEPVANVSRIADQDGLGADDDDWDDDDWDDESDPPAAGDRTRITLHDDMTYDADAVTDSDPPPAPPAPSVGKSVLTSLKNSVNLFGSLFGSDDDSDPS